MIESNAPYMPLRRTPSTGDNISNKNHDSDEQSDKMFDCDEEDDPTFTNYNQQPSKLRRNKHAKVMPEIQVSNLDDTVKNKNSEG